MCDDFDIKAFKDDAAPPVRDSERSTLASKWQDKRGNQDAE
jgi:hypothetical protein